MTKEIILHGEVKYITTDSQDKALFLCEEDLIFLESQGASLIFYRDDSNILQGKIITSTYQQGESLFLDYFGPRQVIYRMATNDQSNQTN